MPDISLRGQLPRFAGIGGIGFVVDASILTLLVNFAGMGPVGARGISFAVAATVTWYLNRTWTFAASASARRSSEYARYVTVQVAGAIINLAIYLLAIELAPRLGRLPVIPLAMGAAVAMIFNFLASRFWVFSQNGGAR